MQAKFDRDMAELQQKMEKQLKDLKDQMANMRGESETSLDTEREKYKKLGKLFLSRRTNVLYS